MVFISMVKKTTADNILIVSLINLILKTGYEIKL